MWGKKKPKRNPRLWALVQKKVRLFLRLLGWCRSYLFIIFLFLWVFCAVCASLKLTVKVFSFSNRLIHHIIFLHRFSSALPEYQKLFFFFGLFFPPTAGTLTSPVLRSSPPFQREGVQWSWPGDAVPFPAYCVLHQPDFRPAAAGWGASGQEQVGPTVITTALSRNAAFWLANCTFKAPGETGY